MIFLKDFMIKKPLIKKNIGTPGNRSKKFRYCVSTFKYPAECTIATCKAAKNLIKLKLLDFTSILKKKWALSYLVFWTCLHKF